MPPSATRIKVSVYEIPLHIQEEIMKRLPVKSLIQFRSVSKEWKSLIDRPDFIAAHSLNCHTQPQHLLVWNKDSDKGVNCAFCYIDDNTISLRRFVPDLPPSIIQLIYPRVVGSSHGLLCLYGYDTNNSTVTDIAVIWNPSIRNSTVVVVPKTSFVGQPFVGFGVCPVTTDPKIVAIKQSWDESNMETNYRCEVMVYSLSSGNWRSLSTNLPTKPNHQRCWTVAADGFIYWYGGSPGHYMIISFDVTNESFEVIDLPTSLARHDRWDLHIYKLRESLAFLQYHHRNTYTYTVWMMKGGVQKSFTKLFTIHAPLNSIRGFTKSGVPILRLENDEQTKLVVYEPNSEHNNVLEVPGDSIVFTVDSYTETLLLLGRSDCSSY